MLNLNVMAQMSGTKKAVASASNVFENVPGLAIVKIASGATAVLPGYVPNSAKVNYLYNNGTMGDTVPLDQYAIATADGVTTFTAPAEKPTEDGERIKEIDRVIVRYNRDATAGVAIHNSADKFPQTIRLILKVLIVDPCDASTLRAAIIDIPSFQPSPEVSITFSSEGTIDEEYVLLNAV